MKRQAMAALLVVGLVMGLLLALQLNTKAPASGNFPTDEWEAREAILKEYLDDQAYLKSRIVSLREQIQESQNDIDVKAESTNLDLLAQLKKDVGLTSISGAGIEITLNDSPLALREGSNVTDSLLVQASDLRDVVNLLRAADAEALSINDQRIIASSPISSVGSSLLINNSHVAPPFIIRAVGDPDIMLQRILNKTLLASIYSRREKKQIVFEIVKKTAISIPIYNSDLKAKYLNLVTQ